MQPSEVGGLPNDLTTYIVAEINEMIKLEQKEKMAIVKILVEAAVGRSVF